MTSYIHNTTWRQVWIQEQFTGVSFIIILILTQGGKQHPHRITPGCARVTGRGESRPLPTDGVSIIRISPHCQKLLRLLVLNFGLGVVGIMLNNNILPEISGRVVLWERI